MSETDTDLPKTLIKRIVKRHLNQLDKNDAKRDTQINKDALLAFSESAKVFINYITATANDICKDNKRQTISIDDIFKALEDTDFLELLVPLKQSLEVFKKDTKEKNQKKAEAKKRKAEHQLEVEQQRSAEQQHDQPPEEDMHAEPAVADQDLAQPVPRPEKQQVPQVQLHEVHHSSQHADELAPGGDQQTAVTSESVQAPVTAETEMLHSTGGHAAHPRTINGDEQMDIG